MRFDYEKLCSFENLEKAYRISRRGKRSTQEVIAFEMNAGANLAQLRQELLDGAYHLSGYYHFTIHDPKVREIYALHYRDRIVQHSLCDNILAPYFETHLIFDNAACRSGKGTLFAINRLSRFLHEHFRRHGTEGYILKCDIRKFFDSVDHEQLKKKLAKVVDDVRTMQMLKSIIDSYEVTPGKGIPMGNQTSQWFALYYLDPMDRLVKEQFRIRHYTRYMDDCILLRQDKNVLQQVLEGMRMLLKELGLEFNEKTQIFPVTAGVEYLGWRFSLTDTGKVILRLKKHSKTRWKHWLRKLMFDYSNGNIEFDKVRESVPSYQNHLSYGNTGALRRKVMKDVVFVRPSESRQKAYQAQDQSV